MTIFLNCCFLFCRRRPQRRSCPYDLLDGDLLQRLAKKSKKRADEDVNDLFYSTIEKFKNLQQVVTARFIAPHNQIKMPLLP
jgi:hypothetical protein